MRFCILFLIKILLAINPPQLPPKTKRHSKEGSPPPLPSKRHSYFINGKNEVIKAHSIVHHKVQSYDVKGKTFYECDDKLFYNYESAKEYCQIANKYETSKLVGNHWHSKQSHSFRRKYLSRSNGDLTYRRKSILGSDDSLMGRKHSLSGSRSSLSGLSRSSSRHSLTQSGNRLSLGKNSVYGSNNDVWIKRHSISGSINNLSSRKDSVFGSTKDLLPKRNSMSGSTGSLSKKRRGSSSEIRNSLPNSRESLNNNAIGNEKSKDHYDKYTDKKPKSHQIWLRVWNLCDVKCYSKQYYDKYKSLVFTEMNLYRQLHKAIPLVLNPKIDTLAQELADEYALRKKLDVGKYYYYGILYANSRIESASTIIKSWYDTIDKYNFLLGKKNSPAALSFTQIVWASTTQIGIGVQHDNGHIFVVCIFYPKGNIKKEYKKNVHKWTN